MRRAPAQPTSPATPPAIVPALSRGVLLAVSLAVVLVAGAACGVDDAAEPVPAAETVEITIEDGTAEPLAQQVRVSPGQEVELVVKADSTGEIHVHSDPEQEFTYEPGTNTFTVSIERPGVVDIETHEPDQLVVQLEVR